MVVPSRKSRDRRRKKERDNTRDSEGEEETCTSEEVMDRGSTLKSVIRTLDHPVTFLRISDASRAKGIAIDEVRITDFKVEPQGFRPSVQRNLSMENESIVNIIEMASHDSGFSTSGMGSALGARKKETVEEKKKPTIQKKLVTENLSGEKSLTHDYQNGDPLSWPSDSASGDSGTQGDRIVNGMRDPSTRPSTNSVSTSTPRGKNNDMTKMASQDSEVEKGSSGLGARKKEKVEKKKQKKKPLTHRHDQNRDVSVSPGTSGVGGTLRDTAVNGMSSMVTLSDHINTIIKRECLTAMKDVLTTALEKVEALESKATKRTIEYEQISPAETPKKKRELSPASSVDAPSLVTTVQRSGSVVGEYPAVPRPGTSGNHHPVDRNISVQTEQSVRVLRQYSSILPVENYVFFEPVHVPEGSRSVTSVTSSQWRQQWMTIDNDNHSVVSGVSSHWRQHRTTDDDNDSDNSGTKSPQSEKKSFFERQDFSNAYEEQPEDADLEALSCNLLECSINGRSPRKTRKGSKSSEMYELSSVKINLSSTRSYVCSPSDRRPFDHVVSSPSRSQPPPSANQRPIIRQPRLSLPATPPQTVYDASARNCRCPRCGSVWMSELELEEHYFEHLLRKRSCGVGGCEYTCSSRNELRRHIRAAHLREHTCRRCGKAYLMASTLERHLRQCLPCRQCPLCPSACVDDASLCDHVASAHGAGQIACNRRPELRYYVCRECRFATTSRPVALDHCQRHILGEINLNITLCEICDLLFVTGDLHFLMHAVDDSFNRKSFQVVDFDWRVSLNARRRLETSLKKIHATKAIKASIDEETSTARSNFEETTIETNDIVSPQAETQLKSQKINNNDSLQVNYNNSDLNQNEFEVTDELIESNNNMQDFIQKYLAQLGTVSKNQSPNTTQHEDVLEPVQSETLVERPLEQQTTVVAKSQSNINLDNNNQNLPCPSRAEVQNQNAASYEETLSAIVTLEELNVETTDIMASPNEVNLESQVILNDKEARVNSVEKNTSLQENNKQTFLDYFKELNKRGAVSKNQSPNTTKQVDVLKASTVKKPVQSETLVERYLEQQNTVAMSQSNDNMDNKNQSLPSSSTAEVQNQNAALYEATSTAITNFKESNVETQDMMASPNEVNLESHVILNDKDARDDSVEEITMLQENNKHTSLDQTNEFNKPKTSKLEVTDSTAKMVAQCGTVSKNQLSNTTQKENTLEANTVEEPVQSETLVERVEQQTTIAMSQSNDNVDNNNQSLPSSLAAEAHNQALDEETSQTTNFKEFNVKTDNVIALSSEMHHDNEARIDSVEGNTLQQTFVNHTNKLNKPNLPKLEENIDKIKYFVQEIKELMQEANKMKGPVQSELLVELNKFHVTDKLIETNLSRLAESINKMHYHMQKYLALRGTVSKNQSPNTTQQEDVLEASTMNKPVQSETLVESRLEQQTTVEMSQSNGNEDPSSSTAEVQNQNAALHEATSTAITNFKESNVETRDIIAPPRKIHVESQVIISDNEARVDSVEEIISHQENKNQIFLDHTKELHKPNLSKLRENLDKLAQCGTHSKSQLLNTTQQEDVFEANTIKEPVQCETLVERPLEQQTLVEMSQTNGNVDNNEYLPCSSAAEVQNQYAALDKEAITSRSNFEDLNEETNDIISLSSEMLLKSQVIDINDEANGYLEEQTWLNLTKSRVNQTIKLMQEINLLQKARNSKKNPVQSEILVEIPVAQQTMVKYSELKNNMNNGQSSDIPFSSTEEVLNKNAALNGETSTTGSNFEDSNVEKTGIMSSPNEVNLESYVILNDKEAGDDSVKENTSLQENNKNTSSDWNNDLNEHNSSQMRENQNLAHYGTDSKNQLSNTTQQEDEANMVKDSELSETLVERPLEQQTTVDISQSNVNVANNKSLPLSNTTQQEDEANMVKDSELSETLVERPLEQQTTVDISQSNVNVANNKSLPSSSAAEVQNQNSALGEDTSNARSNVKDSNVDTNYIMTSPNETHPESQVIANDKKARRDSVEENISLQENNKQTVLDYTNGNNEPNLEQYGTDSKTQLSNTTQHQHILEANTMKDPEQREKLVERPLEQETTVEISQSNGNMDNNKSLPFSLAVELNNQNALNEDSSTDITNFVEPNVKTNRKTVNNDDVKTTTKEDVVNDKNLIKASKSATVNQAYNNKNKPSAIENEVGIEKANIAGERKLLASKLVTENEQKYEVITNQTKEKKILITCSQHKEENNNEASIENNDSEKVALSSIDINITISGARNLSVIAEEANSQNVALDKATQTSVEEAMTSLSALEETNEIEVLTKAQHLTITEQSIRSSSSTEETHTQNVLTKTSHDETTDKDTNNLTSTNNETIIKRDLDKSQGESRAKESMSSGSPKEKTIINDGVSDKGEDQICIELTKTLTITTEKTNPEKADQTDAKATKSLLATETIKKAQDQIITPAELTVSSESHSQATNTNGETSSEENKTVASTTEETYTKDVATERPKDLTSIANPMNAPKTTEKTYTEEVVFGKTHSQTNAEEIEHLVVTEEETDTNQVLTEKPHVESTTEKTMSSASANNETNIKATIDDTQDHQTRAELTVISGSQTGATNVNDDTSGEENKTLVNSVEETYTKDVAIEKAKDLTSNAKPKDSAKTTNESYTNEVVFPKSHSQRNAEETEHLEVTAEGTETKQVLTEKPHVESTTVKTMSSASANNETNIKTTIDEAQDYQTRAEQTVSLGSQTEATNMNDETSSEENKTVATTTDNTYTKDVAIEKAKDLTSNAKAKTSAKIIKESYPKEVVSEIIEETYTIELIFENTHAQINAEETENIVEENDTKQFLIENSHDETTAKETMNSTSTNNIKETKASDDTRAEEPTNPGSPAVESNSKEISEEVQSKMINEETKSSSSTEKTDSEEVLEKGQKSQNRTSVDITISLEKTKETGVKNHLQKTQDTVEKSKQYEKKLTDAKDATFSKTAAVTSNKGQQANRGRGRGNNNKKRNNKNTRKGN